jgi:hypothetical protein
VGGLGRFAGNWPDAALIAARTSPAAPSRSRFSENCRTRVVEPATLVDVICSRPGISANCCSSGVATVAAIVSGLAPGSDALTCRVGKSTSGMGATGNCGQATRPSSITAIDRRTVAIGRRMNGSEIDINRSRRRERPAAPRRRP